jgi:Zn-dependent membrane protease YugP
LRRARWFGSRLAPFFFVLALGLVASQHILFLLGVILLAACLLFWAALVALCRREL